MSGENRHNLNGHWPELALWDFRFSQKWRFKFSSSVA